MIVIITIIGCHLDNPVHIQCGDTEEIIDLEEIIEFYLKNR